MINISVIVPVYNSQKYLEKCIQSVINQTFMNFELILIDDGSKDRSGIICDSYAKKDDRIIVVHKKNGGVSSARNLGINVSNGKYIMFLDSDDELEKNTLSICMKYINEYDFDVIAWSLKTNAGDNSKFFNMSNKKTIAYKGNQKKLYDIRLRGFTGYSIDQIKDSSMHFVVTKLIKKSLITENKLIFDEELKYHEDTIFTAYVLEYANSIVALNEFLYLRNVHNDSASSSFCPTINIINLKSNDIFKIYIEKYHKNDELFEIALFKYQLSWFVQAIKLDVMSSEADYTSRQRLLLLNNLLQNEFYHQDFNIKNKKVNYKFKLLYFLIKKKAVHTLYICAKLNFI